MNQREKDSLIGGETFKFESSVVFKFTSKTKQRAEKLKKICLKLGIK
jgi:hypothetical protein